MKNNDKALEKSASNEAVIFTPNDLKKMLVNFPYPLCVVPLYLALGFAANLWHPMWMLFLTIPIYYTLAGNDSFIKLIYIALQGNKRENVRFADLVELDEDGNLAAQTLPEHKKEENS